MKPRDVIIGAVVFAVIFVGLVIVYKYNIIWF